MDVPEGDYDTLVGVMHHLLAVKDRQPTTDGMFEPLNQTIELLKTYQEDMPEQVYQQLEVSLYHIESGGLTNPLKGKKLSMT